MAESIKRLKINITVDARQAKAEAANLRNELLGVFQNLNIPTFNRLVTQLQSFAQAARQARGVMEALHRTMSTPVKLSVAYGTQGAGLPKSTMAAQRARASSPKQMRVYDYAKEASAQLGRKVSSVDILNQLEKSGITGKGGGQVSFGSLVPISQLKSAVKNLETDNKAALKATTVATKEVSKAAKNTTAQIKVFDYVKQFNLRQGTALTNNDLLDQLEKMGVTGKSFGSKVSVTELDKAVKEIEKNDLKRIEKERKAQAKAANTLTAGPQGPYSNIMPKEYLRIKGTDIGDLVEKGMPLEHAKQYTEAWKGINAHVEHYDKLLKNAQKDLAGMQQGTKAHADQQKVVAKAQQDFEKAVKSTNKEMKDANSGVINKGAGQGTQVGGGAGIAAKDLKTIQKVNELYPGLIAGANKYNLALNGTHSALSRVTSSAMNFVKFQIPWFVGASAIFTVISAFSMLGTAMLSYKQTLADVQAITNKSSQEMEIYGKTIQKVSMETSLATTEVGTIGLQLIRAGIDDIREAAKATEIAAKVAVISGEDVNIVADTIATAYFAWGLKAKDMVRVGNTLAATLNFSRLKVEDLGVAYNYLSGTASLMNRSFEETNSIMAVLSNMGMKASTIGTSLSFVFARMIAPTKQMNDYFKVLGIEMKDLDITTKKFADVLDNLQKKGYDASLSMELFGQRAGRTMMFLAMAGPDALRAMEKKIEESTQLTKGLELAMGGPIKQMKQLWNVAQVVAIQLGGTLVPVFQSLIWVLKELTMTIAAGLNFWLSWQGILIGTISLMVIFRKTLSGLTISGGFLALVTKFRELWLILSKLHPVVKAIGIALAVLQAGRWLGGSPSDDIEDMQKQLVKTNDEIKKMTTNVKQLEAAEEGWRSQLEDIKAEYDRIISDQPSIAAHATQMKDLFEQTTKGTAFEKIGADMENTKKQIAGMTEEMRKFNEEMNKPKPGFREKVQGFFDGMFGVESKGGPTTETIRQNLQLPDISQFKDAIKDWDSDETIRMIRDYGLAGLIFGKPGARSEAMQRGLAQSNEEMNEIQEKVIVALREKLKKSMGTGGFMGMGIGNRIDEKQFRDELARINKLDALNNQYETGARQKKEAAKGLNVKNHVEAIKKLAEDEANGVLTMEQKLAEVFAKYESDVKNVFAMNLPQIQHDSRIRELQDVAKSKAVSLLSQRPRIADAVSDEAKKAQAATREMFEYQIKEAENFQKIKDAQDRLAVAKLQAHYDVFDKITQSYFKEGLVSAETYFTERTKMSDMMLAADEAKTANTLEAEKQTLKQQALYLNAQMEDAKAHMSRAVKEFGARKGAKDQEGLGNEIKAAAIEIKDVTNKLKELKFAFDQFEAKKTEEAFNMLKKRANELVGTFQELRAEAGNLYTPFVKNAEILDTVTGLSAQYFTTMGQFPQMYAAITEQLKAKAIVEEGNLKNEINRMDMEIKTGQIEASRMPIAQQNLELLKLKLYWTQKNNAELLKQNEAMRDPSGWSAFQQGAKESLAALGDFAKGMKELGAESVNAFQSSIEQLFNDTLSGKSVKGTDYFKAFGDRIRASLSKMAAGMFTRSITKSIPGLEKALGLEDQKPELQKLTEATEAARAAGDNLSNSIRNQGASFDFLLGKIREVMAALNDLSGKMQQMNIMTPGPLSVPAGMPADVSSLWSLPVGTQNSAATGITPELINAVIQTESGGNPNAYNKSGASGLMQLMPGTFKDMNVGNNIFDAAQNVEAGTKYLALMLKQAGGNLDEALARYNWGPGNVNKYGMGNLPKETQDFIGKVKGQLPQEALGETTKGLSDVSKAIAESKEQVSQFMPVFDNLMGKFLRGIPIVGDLYDALGGANGLIGLITSFGSLFTGSSSTGNIMSGAPTFDASNLAHSGKLIKKMHTGGLNSDEVPIIAQIGERMLSRGQNKQLTDLIQGRNLGPIAYSANAEQNKWYKMLVDAVSVRTPDRSFDVPRRAAAVAGGGGSSSYEVSVPISMPSSARSARDERIKGDLQEEVERVVIKVLRRHT